jgi:hypothetical protein
MTRFIMIAALAAILPGPVAAAEPGEADYAARCSRCHTVAKAVDFTRSHTDTAERLQWLDKKLSRHHARDAKERARIISYLESVRGRAPK